MSAPCQYPPPPNVAPPPPYAGWWWRVLASLIDWTLAFLFLAVPAIPLAAVGYLTLEDETVDTLIDIVSIPWTICSLVAACALFIPTILDYLWPLWDERNEALHDKMAHTWVVRADVAAPGVGVPPVPPTAGGPVQWGP